MYKAKHLPLLALALLVSSTELRAEELPFKVGDKIEVVRGQKSQSLRVEEIKGKWVRSGSGWYNSDLFVWIRIETE